MRLKVRYPPGNALPEAEPLARALRDRETISGRDLAACSTVHLGAANLLTLDDERAGNR
jgi:hypothetical protein